MLTPTKQDLDAVVRGSVSGFETSRGQWASSEQLEFHPYMARRVASIHSDGRVERARLRIPIAASPNSCIVNRHQQM